MAREPLSLVVTTLDNAATLARCLDSVPFADEIVVLDSGSTDATLQIARAPCARSASVLPSTPIHSASSHQNNNPHQAE